MDDPKAKYMAALMLAKEAAALQADLDLPISKRTLTLQPEGKIEVVHTQITLREWMGENSPPSVFVKIDFCTRTWKKGAYYWEAAANLVEKIEKRVAAHEEVLKDEHMATVYDSARSALADIHAEFHPLASALHQHDDAPEITPEMARAAEDFVRSRSVLETKGVIKCTPCGNRGPGGRVLQEHIRYAE